MQHSGCLLIFWTQFQSLSSLVTDKLSVTHSFAHCCLVDFIDVPLAVDYVNSKVLDIVGVYVDFSDNLVPFLVSLTVDL